MKRVYFFTTLLLSAFIVSCSPTTEEKEQEAKEMSTQKRLTIEAILEEYNECSSNAESRNDCKNFTARAICEYYGIDDLKKEGDYVEYHDIYNFLTTDDSWKNLGMATVQETLDNAQKMANEGFAVVAIDVEDKHKLAIVIIEGEQVKSGSWGLNAPQCAAFFPASGPKPFIHKTLNYAFSSPESIQLWVKK
jgi:hypothetical protein